VTVQRISLAQLREDIFGGQLSPENWWNLAPRPEETLALVEAVEAAEAAARFLNDKSDYTIAEGNRIRHRFEESLARFDFEEQA
jgi:hypothetical protein